MTKRFEQSILPYLPPKKRRRTVAFQSSVTVHESLHAKNYSDEEKAGTWYTALERYNIKLELKKTLLVLCRQGLAGGDTGSWADDPSICTRGLESRIPGHYRRASMHNKDFARRAVFRLQSLCQKGECDPSVISRVYARCSQTANRDAYLLALRDSQERFVFDLSEQVTQDLQQCLEPSPIRQQPSHSNGNAAKNLSGLFLPHGQSLPFLLYDPKLLYHRK